MAAVGGDLVSALRAYSDARASALLTARKTLDIGETDARALLHLIDNPGIRASDLTAYLGGTSASTTTLLDRLADRGTIERRRDADDRRVVRIFPTPAASAAPWDDLAGFDAKIADAVAAGDMDRAQRTAEHLLELVGRAAA